MSTLGDVLRGVKDVLLLQSQVDQLEEQLEAQDKRLHGLMDRVTDIDKRLYAVERIMDLGARQARPGQIEG